MRVFNCGSLFSSLAGLRTAHDGDYIRRFSYRLCDPYVSEGRLVGQKLEPKALSLDNIIPKHPNASQAVEAIEAVGTLDDAFLQKARLGIMSALLALGEADFKLLKEALSLSDGNLSTHLAVLEDKGYIEVRKEFLHRKPRTTYSPTVSGRAAFQLYLLTLERIIRAAKP